MDAAAVVTILAVVLIILALVVFLVGVIVELRKITAGLDVVIGAVGEILRKTEPVNEVVYAINADLGAGTELLEGLLAKEGGSRGRSRPRGVGVSGRGCRDARARGPLRAGQEHRRRLHPGRGAAGAPGPREPARRGRRGRPGAPRRRVFEHRRALALLEPHRPGARGALASRARRRSAAGPRRSSARSREAPTSRRRARRSTWMPATPPMPPWTSPRRPSRAPRTKSRRRTSASAHAPATSGRPSSVPGTRREPRKHRHQLSTSARPASRTRSRCWRRAGRTPG